LDAERSRIVRSNAHNAHRPVGVDRSLSLLLGRGKSSILLCCGAVI
jgi:hypothetical protein